MLNEIVDKYENFSDALVLEIIYNNKSLENKYIEVILRCMNKLNGYEFEIVKLSFFDIISFQFKELENQCSNFISSALLKKENDIIIFDFFPLQYGNSDLIESIDSDFKIKCKKVIFSGL